MFQFNSINYNLRSKAETYCVFCGYKNKKIENKCVICDKDIIHGNPEIFSMSDLQNKNTRISYYKYILKNAKCYSKHLEKEFIDYMEYMHPESRLSFFNKLLVTEPKTNKARLEELFDLDIVDMIDEYLDQ